MTSREQGSKVRSLCISALLISNLATTTFASPIPQADDKEKSAIIKAGKVHDCIADPVSCAAPLENAVKDSGRRLSNGLDNLGMGIEDKLSDASDVTYALFYGNKGKDEDKSHAPTVAKLQKRCTDGEDWLEGTRSPYAPNVDSDRLSNVKPNTDGIPGLQKRQGPTVMPNPYVLPPNPVKKPMSTGKKAGIVGAAVAGTAAVGIAANKMFAQPEKNHADEIVGLVRRSPTPQNPDGGGGGGVEMKVAEHASAPGSHPKAEVHAGGAKTVKKSGGKTKTAGLLVAGAAAGAILINPLRNWWYAANPAVQVNPQPTPTPTPNGVVVQRRDMLDNVSSDAHVGLYKRAPQGKAAESALAMVKHTPKPTKTIVKKKKFGTKSKLATAGLLLTGGGFMYNILKGGKEEKSVKADDQKVIVKRDVEYETDSLVKRGFISKSILLSAIAAMIYGGYRMGMRHQRHMDSQNCRRDLFANDEDEAAIRGIL